MKIIALGHKSRTGKDEFAKFLKDAALSYYPKSRVKIIGFADKLKEVVYLLYRHLGVKEPYYYEQNPEARDIVLPDGKTVVDHWIDFGQHARKYDNDIFTNAALFDQACDVLIIKDFRFYHEIPAIKARNGILVKCNRPGVFGRLTSEADNALNDFTGWDRIEENDGDLSDWYRKAKQLMVDIHAK